ncbi:MAG: hypothetical protein RIS50_1089 [Bacteroidota bacterium]
MIQRIQTVYLFVLFAIGLILAWQDPVYAWFDGQNQPRSYVLMFWNRYTGTAPGEPVMYVADLMTMVVSLAAMAVGIIAIFLFLCGLLLCVLLARFYIFKMGHEEYVGHLGIPLIWPVLMAISAGMAYRGIKADEEMVRSMDRIR